MAKKTYTAAHTGPAALESDTDVFISYRVDPDEVLAEALKRLIEAAITPSPQVFVATVGGLRPDVVTFHEQLRAAAQQAGVFVGVFTLASRKREWMFFEAGAAWGQGAVYAPVLFDIDPSEMPSTVAGYQATFPRKPATVRQLLKAIA